MSPIGDQTVPGQDAPPAAGASWRPELGRQLRAPPSRCSWRKTVSERCWTHAPPAGGSCYICLSLEPRYFDSQPKRKGQTNAWPQWNSFRQCQYIRGQREANFIFMRPVDWWPTSCPTSCRARARSRSSGLQRVRAFRRARQPRCARRRLRHRYQAGWSRSPWWNWTILLCQWSWWTLSKHRVRDREANAARVKTDYFWNGSSLRAWCQSRGEQSSASKISMKDD